jgi:hypothetical protein
MYVTNLEAAKAISSGYVLPQFILDITFGLYSTS